MKELKKNLLLIMATPFGGSEFLSEKLSTVFTYDQLYALLPFEASSIRGAVQGLKQEQLLTLFEKDGKQRAELTSQGVELARAYFPSLFGKAVKKDDVWSIAVLLEAPKRDPHFHATRDLLLSVGFMSLIRGVYVLYGTISTETRVRLKQMSAAPHVLVVESKHFSVGDEGMLLAIAGEREVVEQHSHVFSKQTEKVLAQVEEKKRSDDKKITAFVNWINKASVFFAQNAVLLDLYFPKQIRLHEQRKLYYRIYADISSLLLTQPSSQK